CNGTSSRSAARRATRRRGKHKMRMRCMTAALLVVAASAEAQNANVDAHIAAARAAAGEHAGMVDRLCPREATAAAPRPARPPQRGAPAREEWYAEPVKVFDNLYYVGMTEFSTWA